MKKYFFYLFCINAVLTILFSASIAHAYIDPGTGSMIVQAIIAAIAAVSVSLGIFWRRVKSFLGKVFGRNDNNRNE